MKCKTLLSFGAILLLAFSFSGCIKDKLTHTYKIYRPVYKSAELVRSEIRSEQSRLIINPGKIFVRGNYIFLNELDKGVHIIDNTNPAAPLNVSFINIAGNQDLAVKGNILYADLFTDLVTIDITDPLHASVKNIMKKAFPERVYGNGWAPEGDRFVVDVIVKDTVVVVDDINQPIPFNCPFCNFAFSSTGMMDSKSATGVAGSTARFSLVNEVLYSVSPTALSVFNIANPEEPKFIKKSSMGMGIETIFPMGDKLLMGSTSGVFIYDITKPEEPQRLSQFAHLTACDPVVAENNTAYVTLRSGARCSSAGNQLDILNITDLTRPTLIKTYQMENPKGLSVRGKLLFVCDDGLKVYDATNKNDLKLVDHKKGFASTDIIALANLAIVVTDKGLLQFSYSQDGLLTLVGQKFWDN